MICSTPVSFQAVYTEPHRQSPVKAFEDVLRQNLANTMWSDREPWGANFLVWTTWWPQIESVQFLTITHMDLSDTVARVNVGKCTRTREKSVCFCIFRDYQSDNRSPLVKLSWCPEKIGNTQVTSKSRQFRRCLQFGVARACVLFCLVVWLTSFLFSPMFRDDWLIKSYVWDGLWAITTN